MIGQGRETQEDNNLFYTCGLIDYISRKTKNVRADVVNQLGSSFRQSEKGLATYN